MALEEEYFLPASVNLELEREGLRLRQEKRAALMARLPEIRAEREARRRKWQATIDAMDRSLRCIRDCLEHPMHCYIICYGRPVYVSDRDWARGEPHEDYPIDHYVGWTGRMPIVRVREHAQLSARYLVEVRPGTTADEFRIKLEENCPKCGKSLWYYRVPKPLSMLYPAGEDGKGTPAFVGVDTSRQNVLGRRYRARVDIEDYPGRGRRRGARPARARPPVPRG